MVEFKQFISDLITEVSYRSKEGIADFRNPEHISILSEVLDEIGLTEIKNELFQNLFEDGEQTLDPDQKEKAKQMGLVWKGQGWGKEDEEGIQYKVQNGKLVPFERGEGDGSEEPTTNSLKPGTEGGDTYIDSLPDGDPAKKETPKPSGKTLYSVGGGYYADSPGGEPKYIRTEGVELLDEDITAKNQKGQTITVKPLSTKEKKERATKIYEESEARVKEIYGEDLNSPLLQNSKTSDELLNKGYKAGKYWTAPGNAGSAYNENVSNEGVKILERYPDLSEEELAAILFRRTNGTELGKQQKKTSVHSPTKKNTGTVPNGIEKEEADLYKSAIIAARSAKSKYERAKKGISEAQQQVGFGSNTTIQAFGGTSRTSGKKGNDANTPDDVVTDLEALENEIQTANKCFIYDGETGKTYEIPKDVLSQWVQSSGGGENAADTAVITKDENGNLLYDGWSDKKAFNDLQGNSTLNDDYSKQSSNLSKLEEEGQIDSDTASQSKMIIEESKKQSAQIEADYKKAPKKEAQYFGTLFGEDRERIIQHLKDQEAKYDSDKTTNHVRNTMAYYGVSTHEELLDKLVEESKTGNPSADRLKVINRTADSERTHIKSEGNEIPPGLDTKRILSDARDQALNLQKETMERLNQLKGKTKSGKEKRVGDLLGFQETIDFLHIDKIEEPKSDGDFAAILKRNTQLVMAGVAVPPKNLKECLDVDDMMDYEDNFEVVTEEEIVKDAETKQYTTGKVVYIYALSKDGKERRFVAKKVYRSKDGATGKTSNTIEWSKDMQQCFDSK